MDRGLFPDPVCFPIHILHLFYTPTWGLERHSPEAMLVQRTLHRDRWIAVCFPIQSVSRSTFYIYFTRQRGDLRGTLQKRCWSSGRCTEIGGSRSVVPDPVCFPIHILHLFYTPTWGLERHSPEAMLVQRTLHRDRWIAVCFPIQSVSRSTFYIYFTRQRGDLRGTLQKRCWSSGRCTEIGGSRSVSRSSLFPDPHFTFILHANMGSWEALSRSDAGSADVGYT